jgi:2-(1,2-epoxy-1,2-dihydrophenyl)acetyl-CoA isomerase
MTMAGDESPVLTERREGAVLLVTMNRPHASNALNLDMLRGLSLAWRQAADPAVRAVVLAANGRNFCAGADLRDRPDQTQAVNDLRHAFHPMILALAALDKPVIAAVNGAAAGGGLSIALAADIRLASPEARLIPAWAGIGLSPDLGASWFLPRLIGYGRAFDWAASGDAMDAAAAAGIGLVNAMVAPEDLVQAACDRAKAIAAHPGVGVGLGKMLMRDAPGRGLAEQLEAEARAMAVAGADPQRQQAMATRMTALAKGR